MFKRRFVLETAVGVLLLIVGVVLGFGASTLATNQQRHHRGVRSAYAARHHYEKRVNQEKKSNRRLATTQNANSDPFADIDQMRQEIDRSIARATQQLRLGSAFADLNGNSGYSTALDVRDRGDHFEVRADLPNTDKKDVKVTTEGDRAVRVNVTQHEEKNQNENGGQTTFSEFGSYDQLVTLPGPADMKDMKVDNQNGELVITIPKAKPS